MNLFTNRNRLTDLENEFMLPRGDGKGKRIVREFGIYMYTLLYLKWITSKVLLYNTGNSLCLMLCNNLNGEKNLKKNKYMYMYN